MSRPKSALQHWREAERRTATKNETFLHLATHPTHPLKASELQGLIDLNPSLWGAYRNWLPENGGPLTD